MEAADKCLDCGATSVVMRDGRCINRTRCAKRVQSTRRQYREMLARARKHLLSLGADTTEVDRVLKEVYGCM